MITWLELQNFKCFKHLRLALGGLTLLTGFNGGGKSSAIQPLLLLSQGLRASHRPELFALNGPLVRLGTVGDVLPSDSNTGSMVFTIATYLDELTWVLTTRSGERFLRRQELIVGASAAATRPLSDENAQEDASRRAADVLRRLTYLSAVREGTADAYPVPSSLSEEFGGVGIDGSFAAYLYDQRVDDDVAPRRVHENERATSVRKQLDYWLGTLFPGAQANVQLIPQISQLSLQFRLSEIGPWRRPANIGYGLTYAFPIIVALLTADEGQIVVIDSPEAHLHPSAQSQMGLLLAHFASAGVQIIVETHSDHLLNGARLAVRNGILPYSTLQIHFFTKATKQAHGVMSPALNREGGISEWPDGFFDQSEKDLSRLAGWA